MSSPAKSPLKASNCPSKIVRPRQPEGAILPLAVFLMVVSIAFVALTVDVMRSAYTVQTLQHGTRACALAAFAGQVVSPALPYSQDQAKVNILNRLAEINNNSWNSALKGPDASMEPRSAIRVEEADSEFLVNDQDPNEFFFHVKGKREGSDALKNMFMPLIFAFNSLTGENVGETAPQIDVTVMGQPANRIGKGVSQLSSGSQARLAGFAALPLAISNLQFASLANPASAPLSTYTIDVLRNSSDALTPGHIKGGLVNLTAGTSGYYGDISGEKAVTDNLANFKYFLASAPGAIPPLALERGAVLGVIRPQGQSWDNQLSNWQALAVSLKARPYIYIFPVLKNDPLPGTTGNEVAGFALFQLQDVIVNGSGTSGAALSIVVKPVQSLVLPNACLASRRSLQSQAAMPAPVYPFQARVRTAPASASPSPRCLLLAPAISQAQGG